MKKVYFLKTCSTCTRIMSEFDLSDWELREIKSQPITEQELTEMYERTGSYEALFSKKSTQIKLRNLSVKELSENDFKSLLLDHYTFLKRPVFITDNAIFVGNDKQNIEELRNFLKA